jgi:hypothetical protein
MKKTFILFVALIVSAGIFAQETQSESELAKQAQNPIAAMISVPFQNNTTYRIGTDNSYTQNVLNFQPVFPLTFEKFDVITRAIVPFVSQPNTSGGDNVSGLGDVNLTAFFSPKKESTVTWGLGPVIQFPTATDSDLGSQKFGIGPSLVVIALQGKWVYGVLINNVWTTDDLRTENKMILQPIINYNLEKAWYLVSAPIWQANWNLSDGNQWLVPLGGGIGKIFRIGKLPINANAQVYYNTSMQDPNWGRWQSRFQLQFMFPK